ncbi:portal protein [Serratia phage Eta]|uniref:Putative portal protein n=1 Tax=Serratia phage Eta TaxID=1282995 RepID=R9VWD3_9CAUD|nr:portal protein [Serratia phage Eta]AGN89488.1 putative portal protein [Serratia phage Eta]
MTTGFDTVKTAHREYTANAAKWKKVRDAISGEMRKYLRNVGANEQDAAYGKQRQAEYEDGAIVYNFTKRTLSGMVGSVMRKDPEQQFPTRMEYLNDDASGAGVGLWQHVQDTLMEIDSVGRGGLLVDAPNVDVATMAQQNAGQLNPIIAFYTTENIINWKLKRVGSVNKVVMVVLRELYEYNDSPDEFTTLVGEQYRVLDIDENGNYRQRVYKFDNSGSLQGGVLELFPKLNGVPKGEIPFTFVGASNNDDTIDDAPLLPLADLQVGHFSNSADNEEMLHTLAQAMLIIAPGTNISPQQWLELNPNGVMYGSRRGLNVGAGGSALLLQMQESTALQAALTAKEQQAIQIGAQLITPTTQITAESARLQRGADSSVMATIARNVSQAYEDCLKWVAQMLGLPDSGIEFKLNMEFFLQQMTPQEAQQWMAMVQSGYVPTEAMWEAMRRGGWTNWTNAEMKEKIEAAPVPSISAATPVAGDIPASAQQPQADNQQQNDQQAQQ